MVFCWLMLLLAIFACGTGLAYMSIGEGFITFDSRADASPLVRRAVELLIFSGVVFGSGLCAMFIAGLSAFTVQPSTARVKSPSAEQELALEERDEESHARPRNLYLRNSLRDHKA